MPDKVKPQSGREVGIEVVRILGLEGHGVQRVTLDICPEDVVTVTIRRFAGKLETMELFELIDRYRLVKDDNVEDDADVT